MISRRGLIGLRGLASRGGVRCNSTKPDDRMVGDYPDVKFEYYHNRNPALKYDDQQNRRNFNEPLHYQYEYTDVWSPDRFDMISDKVALRNLGIAALLFGGFSLVVYLFVDHESPAIKRTYPHEGLYKALGGTEKDKQVYQVSIKYIYGNTEPDTPFIIY